MDENEISNVIKIDPKGKYVFILDRQPEQGEIIHIKEIIDARLNDPTPFLFVWGCKLEKIELEE